MEIDSIPKSELELAHNQEVPTHIFLPQGMIVPAEQALFYLLARSIVSPGSIIDAGSFCGASAYAFAAGLQDNQNASLGKTQVHSYDLFSVDDDYTKDYIQNNFYSFFDRTGQQLFKKKAINSGDSFVDIFKFQTQRYRDRIVLNEGSILESFWGLGDIQILFIDVAKTLTIQKHIFKIFFPFLRQGGYLIQQDFHHAYHPYIHVVMEYLSEYFVITHSKVSASRVYRLLRHVPDSIFQRVCEYDFSKEECLTFMRSCVQKSPPEEQALLRICEIRLQVELECFDLAESFIKLFLADYRANPAFEKWLAPEMKRAVGSLAAKVLGDVE
jgi:predicted O-methyltransferase YrrM